MHKEEFVKMIKKELIHHISLESKNVHDPIIVQNIPTGWTCIGTGNYAAVFAHKSEHDFVVKVAAIEDEALKKEANVYKQLGDHQAYSRLIHQGPTYLVLKRLEGITLYDAVARGIRIPETVIQDINHALDYAIERGLNPYDVHSRNVMMKDGKGYVVDVSAFTKKEKTKSGMIWSRPIIKYIKEHCINSLYEFR